MEKTRKKASARLKKNSLIKLQYLEAVDLNTLEPLKNTGNEILVAVAAFLGSTRLIDNIIIRLPPAFAKASAGAAHQGMGIK